MTGHYASAEETASVIRQATPDELWLNTQLDRIAPNRFDADVGESDALVKLVFELQDKLTAATHPQASEPARKPLTAMQRVDICDQCAALDFDDSFLGDVGKIIDLVEAAHEIKGLHL